MVSLTDIGRKNFTEKANLGFLDIYEEHFKDLPGLNVGQNHGIVLLEIGVYNGNSIKTWLDWFGSHSDIIGIDNNPQTYVHDISKARIFKGDQADTEFLKHVVERTYEGFDVIIDDGGHHWDEQQISFDFLWPHVTSGGLYIIEDLQTSDDPFWAGKIEGYNPTSEELSFLTESIMRDIYKGDIASMHIYPRLCILKKR